MNLNSLLEVLNAHKADFFVIIGVNGKVASAVVADNLVKLTVGSGKRDTVDNVLKILGKLDAGTAGALEVVADGKVIVSAAHNDEDYVICKVS